MQTSLPAAVRIVEVGPRDGLQNEQALIPTETKIAYINLLSESGLSMIEATSFVRPRAIPQLADADEVFTRILKAPGVTYPALVPNVKGMERALVAGVRAIAVFTAASESFCKANINCTIAESLHNFAAVVKLAEREGVWVRGYISTCFGCPYEGVVPASKVAEVARSLFELGITELSIGDTIGVATPNQVVEVTTLIAEHMPVEHLAYHFHDTRGTALANVLAALHMGGAIFDSSAGGLGGCPYAPGAAGNLATEDLLYMLTGLGIQTGVNLEKIAAATAYIAGSLGHAPVSKCFQALTSARNAR